MSTALKLDPIIACVSCGRKTFIAETRNLDGRVFRVRECKICGTSHSTTELTTDEYHRFISIEKAAKLTINQITALKEVL